MCLLILEREEGGERERERNINVREKHRSVASHVHPNQGSTPQPRFVPWLEIEPSTFWCMGKRSNQLSYTSQGLLLFFFFFFCWNLPCAKPSRSLRAHWTIDTAHEGQALGHMAGWKCGQWIQRPTDNTQHNVKHILSLQTCYSPETYIFIYIIHEIFLIVSQK